MIPPIPAHETADAADARRFRFLLTLPESHAQAFFWNHRGSRNIRNAVDEQQAREIERFNAREATK
jgi:hypothetical protein